MDYSNLSINEKINIESDELYNYENENNHKNKNGYIEHTYKLYNQKIEKKYENYINKNAKENRNYNKRTVHINNTNSETFNEMQSVDKNNYIHAHCNFSSTKLKNNSISKNFNNNDKYHPIKEHKENEKICNKNISKQCDETNFNDIKREEMDIDDEQFEKIDEYLLNFNYENLFQSNVILNENVKLYIEELINNNKTKKKIYYDIIKSCIITLKNCLNNGYRTNESIINTVVKITKLKIFEDTTPAVAKYACNDLFYKIIKSVNIQIAHPISLIQIHTNESYVGIIIKDLVQNRKGNIIQITKNKEITDLNIMKIFATIPVKHTHNYASILRSLSSGHANFYMTFCGYRKC